VSRLNAEVGSAANSYEVLAKLAMGGMAEIFLARGASATGVERYVVLKRVLRHKSSDTHFVSMFLDEARLAAQLQHPNIAQVYDIGKLGDSFFFTMEYVHGETVRNLLQRSHALRQHIPISTVLSVIAGAAAGLQHAHERKGMDGKPLGIVHRDVSPSNLMISFEGTVKVVDFGVAKAAHRSTETRSGTVKGKITYMSPEQCRGLDTDRRSDLFSLGIVMWEMLTIDRLFRRHSDFDNMQAIVSEEVPPPSTIRADIPPEIERICMRLLAKDPAARFQTADELHEAVEAAAVATGSALSASSLGRYMREIFGQRPEPWIELQSQLSHPEAHTVTGEPLAMGPALTSPSDELDLQLSAVPLLSQRMTAQQEPAVPAARPALLTVPLRVQIDDLAITMHRDVANNVVPLPRPQMTMPMRAPTAQPVATMMMPPAPAPLARPHSPSSTPHQSPHYPVPQTSGSHSMLPSHTAATYQPPRAKRSMLALILVPASVVGIGIGLALAVNSSKRKAPVVHSQPAEPAEPAAPAVVALTPGPTEPTPVVAAAPAPAPAIEPTVPAAPAVPLSEPPSAAPLPPSVMTPPPEPTPAKAPPKAQPAKPDVAALFKAGRFADAVAECNASSKTVALNATTCTVAACKAHESSKAKRWFGNVGSAKRSAVVKECAGVLPAETPPAPATQQKTPDNPCKRDPLACQH
jgi:serine/threonine-protein kinase